MERITKKEFIQEMENNNHVFFGCLRREAATDEIQLAIDNFNNTNSIVETRNVKETHATYLLFNNGSRLLFNQKGKHSFYKLSHAGNTILAYIRDYNGDKHSCYYLIRE